MDAIHAIKTRISTRQFSDKPISDADLHAILEAGMSGPSAVNARPWSFLVIRDKDMLNKMADGNGRAADPLRGADVGILVCGDLERAYQGAPDYWVVDGSIACQNMILSPLTRWASAASGWAPGPRRTRSQHKRRCSICRSTSCPTPSSPLAIPWLTARRRSCCTKRTGCILKSGNTQRGRRNTPTSFCYAAVPFSAARKSFDLR